jgi:hypothetical protein
MWSYTLWCFLQANMLEVVLTALILGYSTKSPVVKQTQTPGEEVAWKLLDRRVPSATHGLDTGASCSISGLPLNRTTARGVSGPWPRRHPPKYKIGPKPRYHKVSKYKTFLHGMSESFFRVGLILKRSRDVAEEAELTWRTRDTASECASHVTQNEHQAEHSHRM